METHEKIERRTFSMAGGAIDGYAGFRVGQSYQLRYTILEDSTVAITLNYHEHCYRYVAKSGKCG